jgi:hypothetical protein
VDGFAKTAFAWRGHCTTWPGWETRLSVEQLAIPFSNFQPTTQPTKSMSYMNFRVLWQSPRSCMLL